jgi:phosphoribosylformylglycinamidine (FGAM) synthase-like enzyme
VSLAEMVMAGGYGARVQLDNIDTARPESARNSSSRHLAEALFSESPSRFLIEVETGESAGWIEDSGRASRGHGVTDRPLHFLESVPSRVPSPVLIGRVTGEPRLLLTNNGREVVDLSIDALKSAWKRPIHETS